VISCPASLFRREVTLGIQPCHGIHHGLSPRHLSDGYGSAVIPPDGHGAKGPPVLNSLLAMSSWEIGTRAQALLELSVPSFSSLTPSPPRSLPSSPSPSINASLADIYTIARTTVAALPPPPTNGSGQPLFIGDTSAGDPASAGIAVLIANWTHFRSGQHEGYDYAGAATAQVQYLFGPEVPKTSDGAISHRVSQLQLWYVRQAASPTALQRQRKTFHTGRSDSVYMVPPFLAYYGMTTNNQSMLQEAYTQVCLAFGFPVTGWQVTRLK
jgi:hypothetical protein